MLVQPKVKKEKLWRSLSFLAQNVTLFIILYVNTVYLLQLIAGTLGRPYKNVKPQAEKFESKINKKKTCKIQFPFCSVECSPEPESDVFTSSSFSVDCSAEFSDLVSFSLSTGCLPEFGAFAFFSLSSVC